MTPRPKPARRLTSSQPRPDSPVARGQISSKHSLERAFEDAPVGIAILDAIGLPIRINRALEDFLGYSCAEFRALTIADTSFPEDVERSAELMLRLYAGEINSYRFEKRYRRKDGSVVWAAVDVSRLRARSANDEHAVAHLVDITAGKQAEVRLNRRLQFERLIGSLATGLINVPREEIDAAIVSALGRICELTAVDRAGVVCVGADRRIRVALQWAASGNPLVVADLFDVAGWFTQKLSSSSIIRVSDVFEQPGITATSAERVASLGIRAFVGVPLLSRGEAPGFLGFSSSTPRAWEEDELTLLRIGAEVVASALKRKDAEVALDESERRIRHVTDNLSQQFWMMERNPPEIIYANPAFERFWRGAEARDSAGTALVPRIHPADHHACLQHVLDAFAAPQELQFRVQLSGGEERWLRSRVFPILDASGATVRVAGIADDVTEQRRAEDAFRYRAALEELINHLAADFMNVATDGIDTAIGGALQALGSFAGVEICYLALFDYAPYGRDQGWAWVAAGAERYRDPVVRVRLDDYPWHKQQLLNLRTLHMNGPQEFPAEAARERADAIAGGIRSIFSVPVIVGGKAVGHLSLNSIAAAPRWSQETMAPLRVVAEMLAAALERMRAELALRRRARFDRLISELSGGFINVPAAEIERSIERALGRLGEFAGADRAAIVLFGKDRKSICNPHEWCAAGVPSVKAMLQDLPASRFPWLVERALAKEIVDTPDLDAMPPEAAADRVELQKLGIRSRIQVPIVSSRGVLGALVFVSLHRAHAWDPQVASLVQIAGQMFGNAIERKSAEDEISTGVSFARMSTQLATGFINLPLERLDTGIESAMRELGQLAAAERGLITRLGQGGRTISVTHEWCADGLPRYAEQLQDMPADAFPWMMERIRSGSPVVLSELEDLPVNAVGEREFMRTLGCRSGIALPLESPVHGVIGAVQLLAIEEHRWTEGTVAVLRVAAGMFLNALERRQAEEESRRHQSDLAHVLRVGTMSELATSIMHDVKQPLAAIAFFSKGCEERVRTGGIANDELGEMLQKLTELAVRAGAIVKQMRDYVRREPARRERRNLSELARAAVALVQSDAVQHRVSIRLGVARRSLPVEVNPVQIEQVVINLLLNAIESISRTVDRTGEILVATRETQEGVAELTVSDSGIGLPPDGFPGVFAPFVTTKREGLGLGLSISRSLIETHGGRIWGVSRDGGHGATFGFTLPLRRR